MKAVGALPSGISNGTPSQNNDRDYLLKISIPLIDDVLGGGLRPSEIVSIAGDNATDRILIALHLVAGILLANEDNEVVFIDSTGTFDPRSLLDICTRRVRAGTSDCAESQLNEELPSQDLRILERMRLMRVFDDAGILDALRETHFACSNPPQESEVLEHGVEGNDSSRSRQACGGIHLGTGVASQDQRCRIRLVVIDNVANVIAPQLSKNQLHGQAILASCGRYFSAIARSFKIPVLILNSTTHVTKISRVNDNGVSEGVSTFPSVLNRPSLGKGFTRLIDLSILTFTLTEASESNEQSTSVSKIRVFEILKDRTGGRAGGWAIF